ncbi:ATP-binding protein [Deinococcus aerophilus]|uniref:ATP-binding protein n=1 Tax=Deinococcus aerophilus TaxID=522488 RepID=UPI00166D838E|nr:AAA family ATPase [Deinococcus aerophilus]
MHAPRQQALLAWLLLHPDAPQPRRQIAFALWPDSEEAQALTNLRRELHHLRRGLPECGRYLEITAQTLRWKHDAPYSVDVQDFGQALGRANGRRTPLDLQRAADLYRGELLCAVDDGWLEPHRRALHGQAVEVLEELAGQLEHTGERTRALHVLERLLALEPLREDVYAGMMRLHLAEGNGAAARQTYDRCAAVLKAELGVEPGPVVQAVCTAAQDSALGTPPTLPGEGPLIGRREEWRRMLRVWQRASAGAAQVLLIAGEAGIGKTRLAEALLALAGTQGARVARTRSYAAEGRLAYAPIGDWLRSPALQAGLGRLGEPWHSELGRLLPELAPSPAQPAPELPSQGWQRQRLFEALARAFLADGPTLLLLDDLQWCDRDTLEWLHYLLRFAPTAPLLLLCTLRREEIEANPAVQAFLQDHQQRGLLEVTELGPLSSEETGALAASLHPGTLSLQAQAQLYEATEGQPLFIVEAVRAGLSFHAGDGSLVLPASARVQATIAARLGQLSSGARSVAQLAATIGRAFEVEVLREASDLEEEPLVAALDELWQRAVVREQPGPSGTYDFTHDRLREGAYTELSPARRRLLHRRVAQALELRHAPDLGHISAQLAAHHEQAGQFERAVGFSLRAAQRANSVSASQQAIAQATRALQLIRHLPAGADRDRQELEAHTTLAAAYTALKGFACPELETALNHALGLGEKMGDEPAIIASLWGLYALHIVRGNVGLSRRLAGRALELAGDHAGLLTDCHQALGGLDQIEGRLDSAAEHFGIANRLYHHNGQRRVLFGADVGAFSLSWGAHGLWLQGRIEEAREHVARAAAITAEQDHPFTVMQTAAYRAVSEQLEHDLDAAWASAEAAVTGCRHYNIAYYHEWGVIVGGWVMARRGDPHAGLVRIQRGLEALRRQDAALRLPYYLALLAETQLQLGQPEAARATLDSAQAMASQNGDVWYLPELYRLRGLTDPQGAQAWFHRARSIAQKHGSLSLELRAVTSLAEHLHREGHDQEAAAALEPVQALFPERLVTPDLSAARALLGLL